jgi:hypothetical protein
LWDNPAHLPDTATASILLSHHAKTRTVDRKQMRPTRSAQRKACGNAKTKETTGFFLKMATTNTNQTRSISTGDWLSGVYRVEGRNFANTYAYAGVVEIQPHGRAHTVVWRLLGGHVYQGIGMASKSSLAVSFQGGVMVFERAGTGSLHGVWTLEDGLQGGQEILTRIRMH